MDEPQGELLDEPLDVTRTRAAYDAVAVSYEELLRDLMADKPYDRAMLSTFAERVRGTGNLSVRDAGCGPGRIAGHLDSCGLDVRGIDLSPAMAAVARKAYPALEFSVARSKPWTLRRHRLAESSPGTR